MLEDSDLQRKAHHSARLAQGMCSVPRDFREMATAAHNGQQRQASYPDDPATSRS